MIEIVLDFIVVDMDSLEMLRTVITARPQATLSMIQVRQVNLSESAVCWTAKFDQSNMNW